MSRHYHCDRCGEEVPWVIWDNDNHRDLCFDCKSILDGLKAWKKYVKSAEENLKEGRA